MPAARAAGQSAGGAGRLIAAVTHSALVGCFVVLGLGFGKVGNASGSADGQAPEADPLPTSKRPRT